MSAVRRGKEVLAILCSDLHLTLRPPAARAEEPDWLAAQERVLEQLHLLQGEQDHPPPILVAGDVFDRWNSPVELVNWTITNLPRIHAIPGQHDLPYHSLDLIHRSAYWTMYLHKGEGGIDHLYDALWDFGDFVVQGFPWGVELTPAPESDKIKVALVHHYVWIKGHSYPGAPKSNRVHSLFGDGMGWDVIVCGDNHKGFITKTKSGTVIFNCGTLQRRKTNEIDYHPQVGLLRADGSVEPHFLNISKDIISSSREVKVKEQDIQLEGFLDELQKLGGDSLDFQTAVHQAMDNKGVPEEVRRILLEAMG